MFALFHNNKKLSEFLKKVTLKPGLFSLYNSRTYHCINNSKKSRTPLIRPWELPISSTKNG